MIFLIINIEFSRFQTVNERRINGKRRVNPPFTLKLTPCIKETPITKATLTNIIGI